MYVLYENYAVQFLQSMRLLKFMLFSFMQCGFVFIRLLKPLQLCGFANFQPMSCSFRNFATCVVYAILQPMRSWPKNAKNADIALNCIVVLCSSVFVADMVYKAGV